MKRLLYGMMLVTLLFSLTSCYSCQSWNDGWGKGPREAWPPDKAFWDKDCRRIAPAAPKPTPAPAQAPKPEAKPVPSGCGPYTVERTYPCGDCGVIKLQKVMPREVTLNAPFTYEIVVTNLTNMMVADVVVTEILDGNLKYSSSIPSAKVVGNELVWVIGELEAGETKKIQVTGAAAAGECIKTCATITYVVPACANVQVVQPALRLAKTAPSEVLLCDPIPVKITVTNTGTGLAENVKVADTLPAGLLTSDGKSSVTLDAGTLSAGQSKSFSMDLKASKTGSYVNKATVTAAGGLAGEASTTTVVRQPVLAITKTGPEKLYLGRPAEYKITVTNKGDAAATGTVLEDTIPAGVTAVKASDGGKTSGSNVIWNIGTLAAGATRTVSVSYTPTVMGTASNTVKATAVCAEGVSASVRTEVAGIGAVLIEVIDLSDPIEVGNMVTYEVVVTNQGSIPDTNIKIVCTLEENQQYVSSSGATIGTLQGNTVTFAPLPTLAPRAEATWLINVKAVKAGDVRFTAVMDTDQLTRPVQETEATHIY